MEKKAKIFIAGHNGMVGSAIKQLLEEEGYANLIFRKSSELDLKDQRAVENFFLQEKPKYVFIAAAKVGGIHANNTYKADFIYENVQIQTNLIHSSWKSGVKKLLFISCSCAYPKTCPQPMKEEQLLTGSLEPTNEPFAVAKIAGIKMCEAYNKQYGTNFISVIPASLFGPKDNFDPLNSHLVPALIKKFHEAKINNKNEVVLWGTGVPRRELMYVNDAAKACLFLMKDYNSSDVINAGTGRELSIKEIAELIKDVVGFKGEIIFDTNKPDGMIRKLLDSNKIKQLGWESGFDLKKGLEETYQWYLENLADKKTKQLDENTIKLLEEKALWVRKETLKIHKQCREMRIASCLSNIEIFTTLYYAKILNFNPKDISWESRDRFIVSKAHGAVSLYPILADFGFLDKKELERVGAENSILGSIPDCRVPGFETINGSLGHGLGVACGIALALKRKAIDANVFVVIGDGELYEGAVWEAAMFAAHNCLDNLILIIDHNKMSMLGYCKNIVDLRPLDAKFKAFNWKTKIVDGHNIKELYSVLKELKADRNGLPKVLIADTIKGAGVPKLETDPLSHVKSVDPHEIDTIIERLDNANRN